MVPNSVFLIHTTYRYILIFVLILLPTYIFSLSSRTPLPPAFTQSAMKFCSILAPFVFTALAVTVAIPDVEDTTTDATDSPIDLDFEVSRQVENPSPPLSNIFSLCCLNTPLFSRHSFHACLD